jgi:hypothetical protein
MDIGITPDQHTSIGSGCSFPKIFHIKLRAGNFRGNSLSFTHFRKLGTGTEQHVTTG